MIKSPKILVIVPAYNEEESIIEVINDLLNENPEWSILIVNDGSKDNTSKIVKKDGRTEIIDLVLNLGIGGAVQTGFKYAVNNDFDICFQFDGDGQHIASEATKIVEQVKNNECDVCIGSRFRDKGSEWRSSFLRRIGIKIFSILNSLLIRRYITDNTSGLRAYNKKAIKFLAENYPMDYPEPEAVILLGKNGFFIKEIPAKMRARFGGTSSISFSKSIYYMIKVILAILITSIKPKIK